MLLLLQDLKGDHFDIHEKFEQLWVDNCKDFKTVPAHVIELNIRNCASFEYAPESVQKLTVENCPRYLPTINEERIKSWLTELNKPFEEMSGIKELHDEIAQLNKKIKDLESQLAGK